ncbi:MAG: response regulator [Myxococcota bacterium]
MTGVRTDADAGEGIPAGAGMFSLVQHLAGLGVWNWDLRADALRWSEELCRIHGVAPDAAPASFDAYLELIHPEDRDGYAGTVREALAEGAGFSFEHRIHRTDAIPRVLESVGTVVPDASGRPARMVGCCLDVTEKRALQREVARAERERALGSFAAQVAHELNNPLTSLQAGIEYLESVLVAPRADVGHVLRDMREGLVRIRDSVRELPHHAHDPDVVRFATLGARATTPAAPPAAPVALRPRRVLVVDDDALVARSLRRLLRPHVVVHAPSAARALGLLEEDPAYDVVLCDLMMPGGTGPELHAVIARRWPELDARMVFITGGAFTKEAATFAFAEQHRVLLKPIDRAELVATVEEVVSRTQSAPR